MDAVLLFNGNKYNGKVEITESALSFTFSELSTIKLVLQITLIDIVLIDYFKLYNITISGLEIITLAGTQYVFIVDDPPELRLLIHQYF